MKKYEVTLQTKDFLDIDEIFENSYEWSDGMYNQNTYQEYKKIFKSFIPKQYRQYLKIEEIKDFFRDDVLRTVCQAYTNDLESQVVDLASEYIKETIDENGVDVAYTLDYKGSTLLGFSEEIVLTFDRKQAVDFERSRGYDERNYLTFAEVVEENIRENKGKFYYNVDANYHWDDVAKLREGFDDYNEVIYVIEKLLKKKQAVVKSNIKRKIPLIYRQAKIDLVF
jgi:hypothetical protein